MTNQQFGTLAYTKSPKISRRTTFQDELQAAVSARASKTKTDRYSYSDDFNEDEEAFLSGWRLLSWSTTIHLGRDAKVQLKAPEKASFFNELLKSRKKRAGVLKSGKNKSKINNFEISDDEGISSRTKRVSFLKTQRNVSPSEDTTPSESRENEPPNSATGQHDSFSGSFSSQRSTNISEDNIQFKSSDVESTEPQITRESSSKSLSYQTSDDTLLDMPLPLPSDNSVIETPGPEENNNSVLEESSQTPQISGADLKPVSSADTEREPPRPKPRQRTLGLTLHAVEKIAEDAESQDLSRPQTSSASIPLSTDTSSNIAWTEGGDHTVSWSLSKSPSSKSEQSQLTKSTVDSGSRDGFISDDSKEQERKYSTSFEEFNAGDHSHQLSQEKSFDTRTSSSLSKTTPRSQSVCSRKVESKYLGTFKLLDRKVSLQESQPQTADSLRAAVYQEWLQKKKEESRENMQLKKKEEILKEKKKKEEEAKKEIAVSSYKVWKEKKAASLKAKAREKQDMLSKEQRATEEKEEKKESAKRVFDQWKREHDHLLKEKFRKQREAENKLKYSKQEKEEERKRDSESAFSDWREKKKDVLHEKVTKEREKIKTKAEEECYMKEERDKMSLEMYEKWLARKDLEQKRQRDERRIEAILQDSPPPPWSPPNKTIPFRK